VAAPELRIRDFSEIWVWARGKFSAGISASRSACAGLLRAAAAVAVINSAASAAFRESARSFILKIAGYAKAEISGADPR
jgi:hypothetical protein